jgi:hypothetical protein
MLFFSKIYMHWKNAKKQIFNRQIAISRLQFADLIFPPTDISNKMHCQFYFSQWHATSKPETALKNNL